MSGEFELRGGSDRHADRGERLAHGNFPRVCLSTQYSTACRCPPPSPVARIERSEIRDQHGNAFPGFRLRSTRATGKVGWGLCGYCLRRRIASPRGETARGRRTGILAKRNTPKKAHKFKHLQRPSPKVTKEQLGGSGHTLIIHYRRAEIASAIATVRRAMSACMRSTIRPSSWTTPLA